MRWFLTARDTPARLAEQAPLSADPPDAALPGVCVRPDRRFQALEGFGGAFTEAAAVTWLQLDGAQREALLRHYFDPVEGHGYSLCRVHMNSCDFALGHYAHAETPGDTALAGYSIERDRRALLPFIQAAQRVAGRPLKLLVSPWSPPAWMKSNGQMNHGGRLLPQYRAAWARCYVRFIEAYAREGVPVWGLTVQNEPAATQRWDSCLYSAEEERDFVRDHLGPALEAAGLGDVRIVVWDHNRDQLVERAAVIYGDSEAARRVWGAGFHWYGEDHFDQVQLLHDAWPDKQLLFTEGCQEGGPHDGSWDLGERYARSMINDLNRWTVGWIDWNLLLDAHGGPNHVGNYCSAPVLSDGAALRLQSSYHYIGHFARHARPGARRVLCAATREVLECTAFANADGSVATVVMNRSEQPQSFRLDIGGRCARADLPPRSIATYLA
ncbi:MAG: glycoside hydrolase family 30 protein [Burkholderiales bacterium]|nr:glucosylceramidase [Burkholderiales bacterium]MDE1926536.1 glycoside hydrolase family 30 protein [Burkholderiales bacterium]MDE2158274.1 glycoside hydrolase family 30 protein [Burkholderiales bacterium]MDE2501663.1 glycoside hydrolase family 30 protein [Burkholderiales bacterium]